jgi:Family of unknown function (DUF6069)
MTTITSTSSSSLATPATKARTGNGRRLWKTGAVAGVTAATGTTAFAAALEALGVSFEIKGEAIPLVGFAQMVLLGTIIGTVLAVVLARKVSHPRRTFVITTVALTALTFVPDITANAPGSTRLALALSHVVAAAIVIPALASKLSD